MLETHKYKQDYFYLYDVLNENIKINYIKLKNDDKQLKFKNMLLLLWRYVGNNLIGEHPLLIKKNNFEYDAYKNRIFNVMYHYINNIPYRRRYLYFKEDNNDEYIFFRLNENIERIYKNKDVKYREMNDEERNNILNMKIYYTLIYDITDKEYLLNHMEKYFHCY